MEIIKKHHRMNAKSLKSFMPACCWMAYHESARYKSKDNSKIKIWVEIIYSVTYLYQTKEDHIVMDILKFQKQGVWMK